MRTGRAAAQAIPAIPATALQPTGPLLGGYALVACAAAWLVGIALRPVSVLAGLPASAWLGVGAGFLVLAIALRVSAQRSRNPGAARRGQRATVLALGVALLGIALALGAARAASVETTHDPHAIARLANGHATVVQGTVSAEPDVRGGFRLLLVDVTAASQDGGHNFQPASGRIEALVYGPDDWFAPAYGDSVSLSGNLVAAAGTAPATVPARLLRARATVLVRGDGVGWLASLYALRVRIAQAVQRSLPEPEAALLIGILLGLKTPVLRARLPLFTATGTIHLVVPAGLKVSVLAELASRTARPLGRWPRTLAALLAVTVYAALGGGGPAATRAAIMGALLALAPALGRVYNVFNALALAAVAMTALDPTLLYDAGFQLTVLATLGLPLLVPPIERRLARVCMRLRLPATGIIAELLAVTMAAQVATLPVLALTFHEVSFIAPVANLLTVPLLAPVLVLGAALALAALLPGAVAAALALGLSWLLWPLLWLMNAAIAGCAALPGAAALNVQLPAFVAVVYYAVLGAAVWLWPRRAGWLSRRGTVAANPRGALAPPAADERRRGLRGVVVALALVAVLGASGATAPVALSGGVAHLDFLDLGAGGTAALLRLPDGVTVAVNGGPDGPALEAALAARLPFWQRSLDLALLTDPQPGDARGLEDAAAHYAIHSAADAGMVHPSSEYLAWLDALRRAGDRHVVMRQGTAFQLGTDSTLRVLSPPASLYQPGHGSTTASNDAMLRLTTPGLRVLWLGSADAYALDALAQSGQELTADVVEVAVPRGAPLAIAGPLGVVLARAQARLIVVCDAPVSVHAGQASGAVAADADAAALLHTPIARLSASGTVALSGGAGGWSLTE